MAEEHDMGSRAPAAEMLDEYGMPIRSGGGSGRSGKRVRRSSNQASSKTAPSTDDTGEIPVDQQILYWMFVALVIGATALQKIGYNPTPAVIVPLFIPLVFGVLAIGIMFAKPIFRPTRAILYLVVVITSTLSSILLAPTYSIGSMLLYFLLYLPYLVSFEVTRETYRRCLDFFSTTMLVFGAFVWLQHGVQFTAGPAYWPSLDKILPQQFLIPLFNYLQPIQYGMSLMKPNGFTFLEVSILSQFLTFALIMEIVHLQRMWRAVFFGATLFATFAGTGLFLLLVALPLLFTKMNTRTFMIVLGAVFVALFVAIELHWFDLVANRVDEFQKAGSSANSRFIAPLDRIRQALSDQHAVYSGVGAGQIERSTNAFWWPIAKFSVEYGLIEGILFYVFYLYTLFDNAPSSRLAFVVAIWFSFEATPLTAINALGCVMFSTMFWLADEVPSGRRCRRSKREDTPPLAPAFR